VLGDPADEEGACDDGEILRNRIFRPGDDGIRAAGSGNRVESNRIQEPPGVGIVLEDAFAGTGNRFFRNKMKKVGNTGMRIGGADNIVERNNMTQTGDLGLSLEGTGGHRAESNTIKKTVEEGIEVQPGAVDCELVRNKVIRSGDDGIDVKAGNATVLANKVVKAQDDGIDINDADGCTIENNVVLRSADYGLQLDSEGNTIRFNKVRGSGAFDLADRGGPGASSYFKNRFGTVDPEDDPFNPVD
jgi:parallel beta-helix repeat protein